MFWMKRIVAVDYADGSPRLVRAVRRGTRITWRPLPLASAVAPSTDELLVAGLQVGSVTSSWLTTPLKAQHKVRQILPSVLDTTLPYALESCAYAFSALRDGTEAGLPVARAEGTAALAVVARKCDVLEQEKVAARDALTVHFFDHEGLALWSSVVPARADTLRVMVWCRPASMLVVLGIGSIYWSSHAVPGHDIEDVLRLVRLQKQVVAKGRYKDAVLAWYIGGDPEYVSVLQDDLAGVPDDQKAVLPDGPYHLAHALARRALLPGPWRIPPLVGAAGEAFVQRIGQQRTRNSIGLLLTLSLLLAVTVQGRRHYVQQQLRRQDQVLQQTVERIIGYPVSARGRDAVQAAGRELAARRRMMEPFMGDLDFSAVAGRIAAVTQENDGYLQHVSIDPDEIAIRVWLPERLASDIYSQCLDDANYSLMRVETLQEQDAMRLFLVRAERRRP